MNQFILFILDHLKSALLLALFAVIICGILLFFTKKRFDAKYQGTKTFPMKKMLLFLVFVGYIVVLLCATILRGIYGGGLNLHLFSGWIEAWNNFSIKSWLNLLLNIALFIPLGFLLPLLSKKFENPLLSFSTGFGTSLGLEVLQLFMKRGLFDVDDLFTNTLGNFIGYSCMMFLLTLKNRPPKMKQKLIGSCIVPITTLAVITGIFTTYHFKEYGNLPYAPTYRLDTSNITWKLSTDLSNTPCEALICQTTPFNKEACDAFGHEFMERIGYADNMDVHYYEEETYFMNRTSGHFLEVSIYDGSYRFHEIGIDNNATPIQADEATIRKALEFYGICIPENAIFAYEENGWHTFTVERTDNAQELGGTLRCQYTDENKLCEIQNKLVKYKPYKTETILSPMEAYEKLKNGECSNNGYFEYYKPQEVEIISCELEYQIDTKGFYQPVYAFKIVLDGVNEEGILFYVSGM